MVDAQVVLPLPFGHWLDSENAADDVVEEITEKAYAVVLQHYIDTRVVPFAVNAAVEEMVQAIEWLFLPPDPGEDDTDSSWIPDVEPVPAEIDSWARFCLPLREPTPANSFPPKAPKSRPESTHSSRSSRFLRSRISIRTSRPATSLSQHTAASQTGTNTNTSTSPTKRRRTTTTRQRTADEAEKVDEPVHKAFKQLSVNDKKTLVDVLREQEAARYEQIKHQMRGREYMYDRNGEPYAVTRVNVEQLPPLFVRLKWSIEEDDAEVRSGGKQKQTPSKRTSRADTVSTTEETTEDSSTIGKTLPVRIAAKLKRKKNGTKGAIAEAPPLIDIIKVASGVTLRDGSRTISGPPQQYSARRVPPKRAVEEEAGAEAKNASTVGDRSSNSAGYSRQPSAGITEGSLLKAPAYLPEPKVPQGAVPARSRSVPPTPGTGSNGIFRRREQSETKNIPHRPSSLPSKPSQPPRSPDADALFLPVIPQTASVVGMAGAAAISASKPGTDYASKFAARTMARATSAPSG